MAQVTARRIAIENLHDEQMNQYRWIEYPHPPRMADRFAKFENGLLIQQIVQVILDGLNRLVDTDHPWSPV
jgi:hypothetical protein